MAAYFQEADPARVLAAYPIGDAFLQGTARLGVEALRAVQEGRFAALMRRGWEIPFYRRLWGAAGLEPGDIKGIDDLAKLPSFSKSDLMASVEAYPPFGDFHGMDGAEGRRSVVLHTTSGTTGTPQPLFFGAWDREVQNALLARAYLLQGMTARDVVHSTYGFGMVNGGHYIREAVARFVGSLFLPAGTGLETRSEQQVALMRRFGATAIVGFADYILKLAAVAREAGLKPGRDIPIRMISGHLGADGHEAMAKAWPGAAVYDWYGVGDTGIIAAEGPDHDGLYIWEDAHLVEILDPDRLTPVDTGERGNICVTVLFKNTIYPVIRFNTNDVSSILPGRGGIGIGFRRLAGFQGRSDNMVKLRGINVYPTGIGAILNEIMGLNGEYVCRLVRRAGQEELIVMAEASAPAVADKAALGQHVRDVLRQRLGVAMVVELTEAGGTAALSQIDARQKPIRLIDER
ncbi:MAG: phenylacetate--CoA ligase family protein [Acetobacteraceae bacterium]|nr:phenylacetate--CoA ligase family protein [Acetobacteraceae bacterium]MSP29534.1 phenylacetate--CoA ligase family protein [Acetobacteraceae bacterium]